MNEIWDFDQFGESLALIDEYGNEISYKQLEIEGNIIGELIGERQLAFLLCRNTVGSIVGYVGFLNNRIVPVLLNSNLEIDLLRNLLTIYKPVYLWLPCDLVESYSGMEVIYEKYDYVLLKTSFDKQFPLYKDLGLLLTTSGSTGSPKFVRQSYENIYENAKSITNYLELNKDEKPITTLPMNYTYGLSIINSHLMVGATILVTEKGIIQKDFWNFFREAGATSFGGVPYTYEMLNRINFFGMDLPTLRTMTQAGGKILPELHRKFACYAADSNRKFVVMYGQCEATARMGYLPWDMAVTKIGSMGIAIPGGKFYLIDDNGNEILEPLTTGELVYEGRNVTLGYAERGEDLIRGDERRGVLKTGDLAHFDEEGYYYIVGRKKRFIKIFGNRVSLDEVDSLIKCELAIEAACAGIDDNLYIFITDNTYEKSVIQYLSSKMKINRSAFRVIVLDEIPKNDAGKVLYGELKKYYGS